MGAGGASSKKVEGSAGRMSAPRASDGSREKGREGRIGPPETEDPMRPARGALAPGPALRRSRHHGRSLDAVRLKRWIANHVYEGLADDGAESSWFFVFC